MRSVDVLHWDKNAQKTGIIYTVRQTISRGKKSGYAYVCFPRYTPSAPIYFCLPKFNVGLNQKRVSQMRPAWGADAKRVRKEKRKKKFCYFSFSFPTQRRLYLRQLLSKSLIRLNETNKERNRNISSLFYLVHCLTTQGLWVCLSPDRLISLPNLMFQTLLIQFYRAAKTASPGLKMAQ